MKLSELLGVRVVDSTGEFVGRVSDVRLVQDGPPIGPFGAALRVTGLIVAPRRHVNYVGYERAEVNGPWLISTVVRWLHRHTVYAEWSDIAHREPDVITLSRAKDELQAPGPPRRRTGSGAGAR